MSLTYKPRYYPRKVYDGMLPLDLDGKAIDDIDVDLFERVVPIGKKRTSRFALALADPSEVCSVRDALCAAYMQGFADATNLSDEEVK